MLVSLKCCQAECPLLLSHIYQNIIFTMLAAPWRRLSNRLLARCFIVRVGHVSCVMCKLLISVLSIMNRLIAFKPVEDRPGNVCAKPPDPSHRVLVFLKDLQLEPGQRKQVQLALGSPNLLLQP